MIDLIVDGQWGSSGKGKLAQFLQNRKHYDAVAISARPNAGHTFITEDGPLVFHQLPVAGHDEDVHDILIGPGSVIKPEVLMAELEKIIDPDRVIVDWRAAVIDEEDAAAEEKSLRKISSTLQGTGAALARKVMRDVSVCAKAKGAKFWYPARLGDTVERLRANLSAGESVLMESTQGLELSLNASPFYPFTTSHDCTPSGILAPWAVPWQEVREIWGAVRTYPIRVGSLPDGYSGDVYDDQKELVWAEVMERCGHPGPVETFLELTSTTKRIRRIFEWSWKQWRRFIWSCRPDNLFISHMDHVDHACYGASALDGPFATTKTRKWIADLLLGTPGKRIEEIAFGTGPALGHMVAAKVDTLTDGAE